MRQKFLNSVKFSGDHSDNTSVFSLVNNDDYALKSPVIKLRNLSKTYLHSIALKQLIFQLEENFQAPDRETQEIFKDSEYLERIYMLWGDSAQWLENT